MATPARRIQHFWAGLLLIRVCWPLNWSPGLGPTRTACLFFPLWLGYAGYIPFALELFALKNSVWPGSPKLHL